MLPHRRWIPVIALLSALLIVACSGDDKEKDGGPGDGAITIDSNLPPGYKLWPCTTPGVACNAHDPCAINPVCGPDKLCRPEKLQRCDDGLDCTDDICKGLGLCENKPKSGWCALPVKTSTQEDGGVPTTEIKCIADGTANTSDPCQVCDTKTSSTKWSGANGGSCNDKNDCTKDDYCQAGVCKGTYYGNQCADAYGCTEDKCDGKGGCTGNPLKSDWCLINGTCYKDQATHPGGSCFICDVSKTQTAWTSISNTCMINSKCYPSGGKHTGGCATCDPKTSTSAWTVQGSFCLIKDVCKKPQDKDSTGCGVCDPTKSKTDWSAVTSHCLIGATCYKDQAKDSTGCMMCDYAKNTKAWTPVAGAKTVAYDFESGATTGWTITNSDKSCGWVISTKRAAGGKTSLYYGDPSTGDYDTGAQNYGTAQLPAFTPAAGKKAGLTFSLWMDTESGTSYDLLQVLANGTKVWESDSTNVPSSKMKSWLEFTVDLSSYAGKSLTIQFKFDTKDDIANSTEGLYIDDITIYHNC